MIQCVRMGSLESALRRWYAAIEAYRYFKKYDKPHPWQTNEREPYKAKRKQLKQEIKAAKNALLDEIYHCIL